MFRKILGRHKLSVSIIATGDTGKDIGAEMIRALKKHGASVNSAVITSKLTRDKETDLFDHRVLIDDTQDGFAKKLNMGIKAAESRREEIDKAIQDVLPDDKDGLQLIITGAGATGLASTLIVIDILYNSYRRVPPIITLLPETFENSRVQYNISLFLYKIAFKQDNYGNSILLLDNKPHFREMNEPFSVVAERRLKTLPNAFADLLFASFVDSVSPEFDAKVQDLFDVLHTPGISVFIAEDLSNEETNEVDSSRLSDVISDSVISTTSLSRDQVFDAKNAFIALFNLDKQDTEISFQTEFEANKLFKSFQETRPFIKIVSPETKMESSKPKMRGIISGLALPNRVLQIMRIARNSRKNIIIKELELQKEVIPLDIDRVERLEEKLFKE